MYYAQIISNFINFSIKFLNYCNSGVVRIIKLHKTKLSTNFINNIYDISTCFSSLKYLYDIFCITGIKTKHPH